MKLRIAAVGRLRSGPEADLISDYTTRFNRTGRPLGLGPLEIIEVEDRKGGGMAAEAPLLRKAALGTIVTLDERGRQVTSPEFAQRLAGWRDAAQDVTFVIGGADGIDPTLRSEAQWSLSFGPMVWPHMLVRVMLTEQLYRAASILAGSPYHRE